MSDFKSDEVATFSKVLTLSQDVGEGDLLELLRELGDQFDPSDELEEPYRWAIGSAVNHIAHNIVIHSVHDNLLYILNNQELTDSECRNNCIEYLTKFPKWRNNED